LFDLQKKSNIKPRACYQNNEQRELNIEPRNKENIILNKKCKECENKKNIILKQMAKKG